MLARERERVARLEETYAPHATPPANHDPQEWVSRFVGDRGPLQLSSRVLPEPAWIEDAPEAPADAEAAASPKPRRRRRDPSDDRPRASRGNSVAWGVSALMTVALLVTAAIYFRAADRVSALFQPSVQRGAIAAASADSTESVGVDAAPAAVESSHEVTPAEPEPVAPETPAVERKGPFSIEVATRLDHVDALDERDRIQTLTGIEGWVAPDPEAPGTRFRVVIGIFSAYDRAERAARMLVNSQTLDNATVVSLPRRSTRE